MRTEIAALERRIAKQQLWLHQVDDQVLKVEIERMSSQVRLESAVKRSESLSVDLSKAYEHMARLMRDRLQVEGMSAQNDALVGYLDMLRTADVENEENFVENKTELRKLLGVCKEFRETQERYNRIMEQVQEKETRTKAIIAEVNKLRGFNEELQKLWIMVPASLKESVFRRKGTIKGNIVSQQDMASMHPATLLNTIASHLSRITTEEQHYVNLLAEIREQTEPLLNMDPYAVGLLKPDDRVTIVAEGQPGESAVVLDPNFSGAVKVQMDDGTTRSYMEHELSKVASDAVEKCRPELPKFSMPATEEEEVASPRRGRQGNVRASLPRKGFSGPFGRDST